MAGKQASLERFTKRKVDAVDTEGKREREKGTDAGAERETGKRQKLESRQLDTDAEETEEMVDQMIMDLATDNRTQKQIERDAKRAQKEAEKAAKQAQREAEKAQKEAEKAQREAEKAARQAQREAEKAAKQAQREADRIAKQAKLDARLLEKQNRERERELARLAEEEKLRKRSITNFFKVKTEDDVAVNITTEISTPPKTDFNNYFLPFHIGPNVTLHSKNQEISSKWENLENKTYIPKTPITLPPKPPSISRASDVLQCLNIGSINEANAKFQHVPLKYLKFYENKKPAYFGTFSYTYIDIVDSTHLPTDPCQKVRLPSDTLVIDYDYYSDIDEDDEDGDGEDIDSNDDESDDDDDEDDDTSSDIDTFLDENDATKSSAVAKVMGPLVPVVRHSQQNGNDEFSIYFRSLHWEYTPDAPNTPIDPFCNYWGERPDTRNKSSTPSLTTTPKTVSTGAIASSPIVMTVKRRTIPHGPTRIALRSFIKENAHLSLPTLCEVAVKGGAGGRFKDWSKAIVKNTVREEAVWSKKNGWVLSEPGNESAIEKQVVKDGNEISNVSITDIISTNSLVTIEPSNP